MGSLKDLTGQQFGRLMVIEKRLPAVTKGGQHKTVWRCRCSCGKLVDIVYQQLICGKTKSCGCYNSDLSRDRATKHGYARTRLFNIWVKMKCRCFTTTDAAYKDYGARGILVCEEWKNNFKSFKEWAFANGYDDTLSIDRINNDDGYNPNNCRWATSKQQSNNRRSSRVIIYNGESHTLSEWSAKTGIKYARIQSGLIAGKSLAKIIEEQYSKES